MGAAKFFNERFSGFQTGSYYTGDSTGTNPSHSATTLVSGTTTTADAIKINYVAIEYGGER